MAVSCALTQDLTFSCDVGSGGISKEIYVIELNNLNATTPYTESSGTITAITKLAGKIFRKYQLVQETASFDEGIAGNIQNGTNFYDQKGVIVFNKQTVAKRNEIMILARTPVVIVAQDNNGSWKLYGRVNGMRLLDGSINTGTAFTDRNGYTLNFSVKEAEPAPFVDATVIATLQV